MIQVFTIECSNTEKLEFRLNHFFKHNNNIEIINVQQSLNEYNIVYTMLYKNK
jgi:hypothetical protein